MTITRRITITRKDGRLVSELRKPGEVRLTLDGRPLDGHLIRPVGDGATHNVTALIR